jgi:hypothetical protein
VTSLSPSLAPQFNVRAFPDRVLMPMLIAVCAFSALVGRFCFLLRPFDNDAAIFIYMGQMVSTGGRLCHDLIDNKFPTVGLMTSIIYKAFGICWPAYVTLEALISLATALSLGRTAKRVVGRRAQLPTVLFSLVFLNLTTAVFGGFQLETLQIFFTALAASAGVEMLLCGNLADGFTAGLCAGCGAMFKPTAVGVLLAMLAAMVTLRLIGEARYLPEDKNRRNKPRRTEGTKGIFKHLSALARLAYQALASSHSSFLAQLLAITAGLTIPLTFALIYLTQADLLKDMPALYRQISTYAEASVFDIVELIKPLTALALLGFPLLIRGYVFRRQTKLEMKWQPSAVTVFLISWLMIETIGVILQRRMYAYHFLPMVPPAALLFGMLPRLNRPAVLAASLLPIAFLSILQAANFIATTKLGEDRLPLSDYLLAHAKPGDAVWMDAWPRVVLETGLRPGSRLPFTFLFTNYDTAGLDYSAGMIADFERIKPTFIILPTPLNRRMQYQIDFIPELNRLLIRRESYITGWHRIEQYTRDHYEKEAMVGNDAVYRRRDIIYHSMP